jgi:hypothetical protein
VQISMFRLTYVSHRRRQDYRCRNLHRHVVHRGVCHLWHQLLRRLLLLLLHRYQHHTSSALQRHRKFQSRRQFHQRLCVHFRVFVHAVLVSLTARIALSHSRSMCMSWGCACLRRTALPCTPPRRQRMFNFIVAIYDKDLPLWFVFHVFYSCDGFGLRVQELLALQCRRRCRRHSNNSSTQRACSAI